MMTGPISPSLDAYRRRVLPTLAQAIRTWVETWIPPNEQPLWEMLAYHMGWTQSQGFPGKGIRPLLILLTHEATGGRWEQALPAAAAVELIHNFSLVHDDIQDQDDTRRGRPTVWKKWGVAQAINAGNAFFAAAFAVLEHLYPAFPAETVNKVHALLAQTALHLVRGQVRDLDYEARDQIPLTDYLTMIGGKTAALLAACTEIGPLLSQAPPAMQEKYRSFGWALGMAFQIWDDYLGIWGDPHKTGKPAGSDLLARKKTLPIVYALQTPEFRQEWQTSPITPDNVGQWVERLERLNAREFTREQMLHWTQRALHSLDDIQPQGKAGQALRELVGFLATREH